MYTDSPLEADHSKDVASKGDNPHGSDESEDSRSSGNDLRAAHAKACELVKHVEGNPEADAKLSEEWVQSKLALVNDNLTAIYDFIVNDKKATDTREHGDDGGGGGDMGGGFIISIERALGK